MIGYSPTRGFKKYIKIAKKILADNWTGAYTKPSPRLYPHQWNWDSGFIAIGYAHYDQKKARQEILSLVRGIEGRKRNPRLPQADDGPPEATIQGRRREMVRCF